VQADDAGVGASASSRPLATTARLRDVVNSIGVGHPNFTVAAAKFLFESDILLSPVQAHSILRQLLFNLKRRRQRRGVITNDASVRWTDFPVPYDYDPTYSETGHVPTYKTSQPNSFPALSRRGQEGDRERCQLLEQQDLPDAQAPAGCQPGRLHPLLPWSGLLLHGGQAGRYAEHIAG